MTGTAPDIGKTCTAQRSPHSLARLTVGSEHPDDLLTNEPAPCGTACAVPADALIDVSRHIHNQHVDPGRREQRPPRVDVSLLKVGVVAHHRTGGVQRSRGALALHSRHFRFLIFSETSLGREQLSSQIVTVDSRPVLGITGHPGEREGGLSAAREAAGEDDRRLASGNIGDLHGWWSFHSVSVLATMRGATLACCMPAAPHVLRDYRAG